MRTSLGGQDVKPLDMQRGWLGLGTTIFAFLFLQVSLGIFYWLPEHSLRLALRPSVDLLVVVGLVLLLTTLPKHWARAERPLALLVGPWIALSVALGIAQGIARRSFAYDFVLAYHMSKIQALLKMMYEAQSLIVFVLCMALLLATIVGVTACTIWAMRRFYRVFEGRGRPSIALGACVGAYALIGGLLLGFNGPVAGEVVSQLSEAVHREERTQEEAERITEVRRKIYPIDFGDDVKRPTVLVFVVESYGNVLFEAEKYNDFHPFIAAREKELTDAGYKIRSRTFKAPVFGGSSWLANATFLCRLIIPTEKVYFSLFKTNMPCLPRPFNEAGYHSVFAGSNTTSIDDEYAKLFPFESFYILDDYDYKGPRMSWSYMPDQYIIDQIDKRVLSQESARPRFVYYKLSSSHHPWDTIPPFFADWSRVGDGSVYKEVKSKRYKDNAFLGGRHLNEGYYDSSIYSLKTIFSYLNQFPEDREVLAVLFGDHQPRSPVAEMDRDPWTVPLHVISRDSELIARFEKLQYTEGLQVTSKEESPPGLEDIASQLFTILNDAAIKGDAIDDATGGDATNIVPTNSAP